MIKVRDNHTFAQIFMVKRIIWLVLIFVSANLPAQYRLSGTVKDAKTGQALPGVTGYALINLWGGAEFYGGKTKFLLSLSVRNLTNRTYIPHLSVLREDGIPEPGRNVIFSVKIDF